MYPKNTSFQLLFSSDLITTQKALEQIGATTREVEHRKYVCDLGDYDLHYCLDTEEKVAEYVAIANEQPRGKGIIFYVGVKDLEDIFQKAKTAPGKVINEITVQPWSCREFLWQDPNGYVFAFYHEI